MISRVLWFVIFLLGAGGLGWKIHANFGALIGVSAVALLALLIDSIRAARVMVWLRQPSARTAPQMRGLWGEVTDRVRRQLRQDEQKLQDSERRLQEFLAAIQASPNGVVLLDEQGRIEWCNLTAAEQFGFDASRDLLQWIGNLVRDPQFMAYYSGLDFSHDVVIPGRTDNPLHPERISVQLHPYGEGRKLLLTRDVTSLEQADAMRRDFVANVSHEIRTPLTVLIGFVETLQTLPLDAQERSRYLGMMAQQSHRMQTLVNDLLTLSRLEGSPPPGGHSWTPVHSLMAQCEQEGRALAAVLAPAPGKSQHFQFEQVIDDDIAGSATELYSAWSNLVSNAVRYTPAGGTILVQWCRLADGRGEFSVKDSGPGIAAEHLSRLTERFYRVDRSRSRETGGTGLGLAIVKHVVQRHGAELRIESNVGVGSRFAIRFPLTRLRASGQHLGSSDPWRRAIEAQQK